MKLDVFDPAMCCSTGVCGPSVDPALASFAADLDWVAARGGSVRRYNLGQEPGAFAEREPIRALLHEGGEAALPIVTVDGEVRSSGRYPSRDELAAWAGVALDEPEVSVSVDLIAELAALGSAVGSNCEACFKFHFDKARKLGLSNEQLTVAVRTAQSVKDAPATKMLDLAAKLLRTEANAFRTTAALAPEPVLATTAGGGCCDDAATVEPVAAEATEGGCCGGGATSEATPELIQVGAPSGPSSCC